MPESRLSASSRRLKIRSFVQKSGYLALKNNNKSINSGHNKSRIWTPEDIALLKDLYEEGRSVAYLANRLRRSLAATRMALSRHSVTRPASKTARRAVREPEEDRDIASRLAVLLGEAPRPAGPRRVIPDDLLLEYAGVGIQAPDKREDLDAFIDRRPKQAWDKEALRRLEGFKLFAKDLLDVEFLPWQEAAAYLMLSHSLTCHIVARQAGKDFLLGCFILWESITRPNARTVTIAEAQRQSEAIGERTLAFAAHSPETYDAIFKSNRERMLFTNGSEALFLPATGAIRGYTEVTRAFVNEARAVPDDALDSVSPMLMRLAGSMHLLSTPMARVGPLYEHFQNPVFATQQLPWTVNTHNPPEPVERDRLRMSADAFKREYLGEWSDASGLFFTSNSIDGAREDYDMREVAEEGLTYSFGWDAARFRDTSVLVILSRDDDGLFRVETVRSWDDVPFMSQLAAIQYLYQVFRPAAFVVEAAGLALGPIEQLEEADIPVVRYVPSAAEKLAVYGALKNLFEKGRIKIPSSHTKLITELKMFEFKATPVGNIRLAGSEDDHSDALAFAAWGLRRWGDSFETRAVSELVEAASEGLRGDTLPVGQSQFNPAVADALRQGFGNRGEKMHDPRCASCGASLRTASHIKAHRGTDCPEANKEDA